MPKSKKKQQSRWEIDKEDQSAERLGSIKIHKSQLFKPPEEPVEAAIPPPSMLLRIGQDPGICLGLPKQTGFRHYVGIPQGTDGHVALFGGSGSGKTTGVCIPTTQTWGGPFVATDIKGDLRRGYQSYQRDLLKLSLINRPYIRFNPERVEAPPYDVYRILDNCDETTMIHCFRQIAQALLPLIPRDPNSYWIETARRILAASLCYYYQSYQLGFVNSLMTLADENFMGHCKHLAKCSDLMVRRLVGDVAMTGDKGTAYVEQEIRNAIDVFVTDPQIAHAFRGREDGSKSFWWDDLEAHNIFLQIPEHKIEAWRPAINIMLSQLIDHLLRRSERQYSADDNTRQTLLLFDEFARFGKLEGLVEAMSTLRSRGVNFLLVLQSLAQIDKFYGENDRKIILDNCAYKALLSASDAETQEEFAKMIGTCTKLRHSVNASFDKNLKPIGYSEQVNETNEFRIPPHKLTMADNVKLLIPEHPGFCNLEKIKPGTKLVPATSIPRAFPVSEPVPTLDTPLSPMNNPYENENARILNLGELEKAARIAFVKQKGVSPQDRILDQPERSLYQKVGEIFASYFPVVEGHEDVVGYEDSLTLEELEVIAARLASAPELWRKLRGSAGKEEPRRNS